MTADFPKNELYGITGQIRRAAISIPANISEGSARLRPKEFHYFLRISFGSLSELETLLLIANELNYLDNEGHDILRKKIILITAQLIGLIRSIEKKIHFPQSP